MWINLVISPLLEREQLCRVAIVRYMQPTFSGWLPNVIRVAIRIFIRWISLKVLRIAIYIYAEKKCHKNLPLPPPDAHQSRINYGANIDQIENKDRNVNAHIGQKSLLSCFWSSTREKEILSNLISRLKLHHLKMRVHGFCPSKYFLLSFEEQLYKQHLYVWLQYV